MTPLLHITTSPMLQSSPHKHHRHRSSSAAGIPRVELTSSCNNDTAMTILAVEMVDVTSFGCNNGDAVTTPRWSMSPPPVCKSVASATAPWRNEHDDASSSQHGRASAPTLARSTAAAAMAMDPASAPRTSPSSLHHRRLLCRDMQRWSTSARAAVVVWPWEGLLFSIHGNVSSEREVKGGKNREEDE